MRKLTGFLIATIILAGSGAVAVYLVSLAPEPCRGWMALSTTECARRCKAPIPVPRLGDAYRSWFTTADGR